MTYHVLPGDAVADDFQKTGIEGAVIVCRESFVTGDLDGETLDEFWETRANHVDISYGADPIEYREAVAGELERLLDVNSDDEVNLWFEYELFCSVNMWFCLDLLRGSDAKVFRVMPIETSPDDVWAGFGNYQPEDLVKCLDARVQFSQEDLRAGRDLWKAFRERDSETINRLSEYRSPCFPFLKEVCTAAVEIDSQPIEIVRELKTSGFKDIEGLFPEFRKRAGVYGFGDSQVESLMNRV
jgi:hypothetical protein